jgi:hypothetical protein
MKMTLIGMAFVGASLTLWGGAGCGKKDTSCDAVFAHVKELAPLDMRGVKDGSKAKCERLTVEQRRCILDAKDLGEVAACNRK